MNENFDGLYEQIRKGEIERGDAVFLAANPGYLFQLADELRKEQKGDIVTYLSLIHISEPTRRS